MFRQLYAPIIADHSNEEVIKILSTYHGVIAKININWNRQKFGVIIFKREIIYNCTKLQLNPTNFLDTCLKPFYLTLNDSIDTVIKSMRFFLRYLYLNTVAFAIIQLNIMFPPPLSTTSLSCYAYHSSLCRKHKELHLSVAQK